MTTPIANVTPLLYGQAVLGAAPPLTAALFNGTPAQADLWLGNEPGTTVYAVGPAIAITGVLIGATTEAVETAQAALQAFAGLTPSTALTPTGLSTFGWDLWTGCHFSTTDLIWSTAGIVAATFGGGYQIGYQLLLRRGAPQTSGALNTPSPLAPDSPWAPHPNGPNDPTGYYPQPANPPVPTDYHV